MDFTKVDMTGVAPGTARWKRKIMKQGMLRNRAKFKEEMRPELLRLIEPYSLRLTKRDVGILEPKIS